MTAAVVPGRRSNQISLIVAALMSVGFALVAFFDLQTDLPLLDEYARRWSIQHLVSDHVLHLWGRSPDLVQTALAWIPAELGANPSYWRLPGVLFLALQALFVFLIARDLGADHTWGMLAAACVACAPLSLSLATGIMTETGFIALYLGALWLAIRWLRDPRAAWPCATLSILSVLQRQPGVAMVLIGVAVLALARRRRPLLRADYLGLALLVGGTVLALLLGEALHHSSPATYGVVRRLGGLPFWIYAVAAFSPMLGLFLLPMLGGILLAPAARRGPGWWSLIVVVVAQIGFFFAWLVSLPQRGYILPGPILHPAGLGATLIDGPKPPLFGAPVFLGLEVLVCVAFLGALLLRRNDWQPSTLGAAGGILVLGGLLQFAAIFVQGQAFDRYYMPVVAPLVPLIASRLHLDGARARVAQAWAVAGVVLSLGYYVAGEQDYLAWQRARDQATTMAYAQAPPSQVNAGMEEEASHIWIPATDHPGQGLPTAVASPPLLKLEFAGPDDPRPGVGYRSLAPGRLVITNGTR